MRFNFGLSARITFGAMLLLVAGSLLWIDSENSHQRQSYMGERSADLEAALHVEQARLTQSLERLRQDALFLANTPPVAGMVRAETNNGTDPRDKTSYAVWESRLQEIFAAFLRTHPDYYQLRFIGAAGEGRELVRVESRDGAIQVAQRDALQAKGDQDYFRAGLMLTVGRVHLSEFKLNQEWGKIEEPHRPTINAVTTVFDASGRVFGMVVVNKDVRPLFNSSMAGLPRGVQGYIADQRGHFLFHPDDKHAFSFEFGNNENIADDFPSLKPLLESQTTRNELPFHTVDGGVGGYLAAERVFFDVSDPSRFLLLVYHISSGVADRQASAAAWLNIADIVVFMLLVGVVFLLLLRRTFSPLKRITAAAREIAAGNRNVRLREKDGGEVGELTEALNTMLDKLSDNDLVKQENIFRKELIEALPGIFYMIDARGKFLMWNRNLEQVLKCSPEEVAASLALDFFEGEHKLDIENAIRLGFESGEAEIEAELVAKDGSKAFYHFTGRRIQREGKPVLVGLGIDISLQIENLLMTNALLRRNQALMQNSMDGIHVMDTEGRLLEVNDAFCRMLGYTREEAMQLNVTDWDVHFTAEELREKFRGFIGQNSQFETVHRRKDGSLVDVEICANGVEIDGKGYLFAASRDITERKKLQTVLQRYKQVIETTVDGFWMTDAGGYLEEVNEAYAKMSGYTTQELVGMHISQLEANEREDDVRAHIEKLMATGYDRFETRHRRKDGRIIDIEVAATFMPESAKFFVFSHNITQRKQVEQALRVAAAVFEAHEAILITDAEANIIRVNSAFTEVTGYAAEEVIGQNPRIMSSGRQDKEFYSAMWKQITESGSWAGEIWDRRKSGEIYPKWMTISAVKNERGETTQYVAIFSDISARKREEDLIRSMAFYDALTQLPNRRLFLERFQTALTASERYNDYGAILFIDLDRFKMLNDTMGHEYGDLLLMELAVRIKSCVREVDTVARLGGDEFVVLLESISSERGEAAYNAGRVAEKVRAALSRPYQLKEHEHYSSPSIGISLFHGVDEAMDVLLKHADVAMYQSKEEGGNKIRFFDADLQQQWNSGALNQRWDISE